MDGYINGGGWPSSVAAEFAAGNEGAESSFSPSMVATAAERWQPCAVSLEEVAQAMEAAWPGCPLRPNAEALGLGPDGGWPAAAPPARFVLEGACRPRAARDSHRPTFQL